MAQLAAAPPTHVEEHTTSTGLNNRKVLMWAFLGSDCMFFGSLIIAFLVYRGKWVGHPNPQDVFDIPYTSVSAFALLMSSLAMVLALAAIQRGDVRRLKIWLLTVAGLGLVFIGGQIYEFTSFGAEGLNLATNTGGTTFFVLTGFHGTHVSLGIAWLLSLFVLASQGKITQARSLDVEIAGLYWHFVDIVWIIIFTVVYLIPV
ncbi:MAG TPA: cytochrome c oxidase subunit 3 [Chloroflexota bacterium]|nr:cytochrome c oxidase subunit 3 [Chloroflexota bacterium]